MFVEGREDKKCNKDCGGSAEEEGNVEEGGGIQDEVFVVQQPCIYKAEHNTRVAKVHERL